MPVSANWFSSSETDQMTVCSRGTLGMLPTDCGAAWGVAPAACAAAAGVAAAGLVAAAAGVAPAAGADVAAGAAPAAGAWVGGGAPPLAAAGALVGTSIAWDWQAATAAARDTPPSARTCLRLSLRAIDHSSHVLRASVPNGPGRHGSSR